VGLSQTSHAGSSDGTVSTCSRPAQPVLWQKLTAAIEARAAASEGVVAVGILDLTDGCRYALRGEQVFAVASTIKLTIAAELFRQADAGALSLAQPVSLHPQDVIAGSPILSGLLGPRAASLPLRPLSLRELAVYMIATSDNTATNALIDRLGMPAVNALSARLGLLQTRLRRRMLDGEAVKKGEENTATAAELVTLLAKLWGPGLLSLGSRRDLVHILSVPKDSPFSRGLPDELPLASKPGSLDGVRAEAGIVLLPGRPFVLSAIVAFAPDGAAAERTLAEIARVAHGYFATLASHTAYGRRRPD
jgi:beta-lactamase class A